jgi:hypothetical protein
MTNTLYRILTDPVIYVACILFLIGYLVTRGRE